MRSGNGSGNSNDTEIRYVEVIGWVTSEEWKAAEMRDARAAAQFDLCNFLKILRENDARAFDYLVDLETTVREIRRCYFIPSRFM